MPPVERQTGGVLQTARIRRAVAPVQQRDLADELAGVVTLFLEKHYDDDEPPDDEPPNIATPFMMLVRPSMKRLSASNAESVGGVG